jgi:hypothetical protein
LELGLGLGLRVRVRVRVGAGTGAGAGVRVRVRAARHLRRATLRLGARLRQRQHEVLGLGARLRRLAAIARRLRRELVGPSVQRIELGRRVAVGRTRLVRVGVGARVGARVRVRVRVSVRLRVRVSYHPEPNCRTHLGQPLRTLVAAHLRRHGAPPRHPCHLQLPAPQPRAAEARAAAARVARHLEPESERAHRAALEHGEGAAAGRTTGEAHLLRVGVR